VLEVSSHEGAQLREPHVGGQRQDAQLAVAPGLQALQTSSCRALVRQSLGGIVELVAGSGFAQGRHCIELCFSTF
jgi:hypothetical protein